jgi:electron transfer flavoprotein alpha subunit
MAGCKGAKRILAINSDAEAPIMQNADFVVVGDLKDVIPAISAEIRRQR